MLADRTVSKVVLKGRSMRACRVRQFWRGTRVFRCEFYYEGQARMKNKYILYSCNSGCSNSPRFVPAMWQEWGHTSGHFWAWKYWPYPSGLHLRKRRRWTPNYGTIFDFLTRRNLLLKLVIWGGHTTWKLDSGWGALVLRMHDEYVIICPLITPLTA